MKIYTQTERFILREILPTDEGGFFELDSNRICYAENIASGKVLTKAGLKFIETFDNDGVKHHWYKITRDE